MTTDEKIIKLLEEIRDQQKDFYEKNSELIKAQDNRRQKLIKKIIIFIIVFFIINILAIITTNPF